MGRIYSNGKSYFLYYDCDPDQKPEHYLNIGSSCSLELQEDRVYLVTRTQTFVLFDPQYNEDGNLLLYSSYKELEHKRKKPRFATPEHNHSKEWDGWGLEKVYLSGHLKELTGYYGIDFLEEILTEIKEKPTAMAETLIQRLRAEKVAAMKAKNPLRKGIIDTTLGEVERDPKCRTKVVDGVKQDPADEKVMEVIKKLIKNLSVVDNEQNKQEIEVLKEFMPTQLSESELDTILSDLITSTGAESPRDMGKVMGAFTKQYNGQADNKVVSQLIKNKLLQLQET